ncbi:LTA synthase family protein [Marinobacteraceae bacterium S3BR75-40.1]
MNNRTFVKSLNWAFIWLLLMRAVLWLHSGVLPHPFWMLLADGAGAFFLALLLHAARTWLVRGVFVLLLGSLYLLAAQHLEAHDTLYRLAHFGNAASPVFLSSSVANPQTLLLPVYCFFVWLLFRIHQLLVPQPQPVRVVGWLLAVPVMAFYIAVMPSLTTPSNNLLASTITQVPTTLFSTVYETSEAATAGTNADKVDVESAFFRQQMSSDAPHRRPNVLVIMIEGLSAGYFPSVSRYQGLDPVVELTRLEDYLDSDGFRTYRNVLSMQRQTNRGSFALLCGQYPKVTTQPPKMTEVAQGAEPPTCLPRILSDEGYSTAYLQAAPLDFMHKGDFMPRIGFQQVRGREFFGDGSAPGWGPPDEVFFPEAAQQIQDMARQPGPWFATLLNVGTHHPFDGGKPENDEPLKAELRELAPRHRQDDRRRALHRMESAVIDFLTQLKSQGLLDDTLVILTSDESGGFLRQNQTDADLLDSNAGFLAIRPPGADGKQGLRPRDQLVAQLDVSMTVLDWLGLSPPQDMLGRSLLTHGNVPPRGLLLGDTYTGRTFFLWESGDLMACGEGLILCQNWHFDPERILGSLTPAEGDPFLEHAQRKALVDRASEVSAGDNALP